MKTAFITGITGTLGQEVSRQILDLPDWRVIGFSRDEFKQKNMTPHERLTLVLGDVRDRVRLVESTRNVDLIFHFAALKHVDLLELNPEESIATNVLGTENILSAQRMNKVPRVCLSSTDKAVYPVNVYGACKLLSERLVLRNKNNIVCRWGNVFGSRGSVIHKFIEGLRAENRVGLTHGEMTRFFVRIEDAAKFMLNKSLDPSQTGLQILPMKACSMRWLIDEIAAEINSGPYTVNLTGTRPGEKIHEHLRAFFEGGDVDSGTAERLTSDDVRPWIRELAI